MVVVERILRWVIRVQLKRIAPDEDVATFKYLLLTALAKHLSLFIWAYGIYWALSPLFIHFQTPEGTNLVHLVAQKAADIAGAFAILWFIYRLVDVIDVRDLDLREFAEDIDELAKLFTIMPPPPPGA